MLHQIKISKVPRCIPGILFCTSSKIMLTVPLNSSCRHSIVSLTCSVLSMWAKYCSFIAKPISATYRFSSKLTSIFQLKLYSGPQVQSLLVQIVLTNIIKLDSLVPLVRISIQIKLLVLPVEKLLVPTEPEQGVQSVLQLVRIYTGMLLLLKSFKISDI